MPQQLLVCYSIKSAPRSACATFDPIKLSSIHFVDYFETLPIAMISVRNLYIYTFLFFHVNIAWLNGFLSWYISVPVYMKFKRVFLSIQPKATEWDWPPYDANAMSGLTIVHSNCTAGADVLCILFGTILITCLGEVHYTVINIMQTHILPDHSLSSSSELEISLW